MGCALQTTYFIAYFIVFKNYLPVTVSGSGMAFGVAQFFKVDTVQVGTFSICAGWVTWCCGGLGVDRGPETHKNKSKIYQKQITDGKAFSK